MVDTNVWLGNYVASRAGHESSRRFLQVATQRGVQLLYPSASVKDVFYLIAMEFKRQVRAEKGSVDERDAAIIRRLAWGCVDNMRALATSVGLDESDLWLACKYRKLNGDLEDNMVIAAMQRAKADYLVTLDGHLARHAPVAALTPDDMTSLLQLR